MKENWVYRRGDLYLANLGVPVGSKQGGVRPVKPYNMGMQVSFSFCTKIS